MHHTKKICISLGFAALALLGSVTSAHAAGANGPKSCVTTIKKIPGQHGKSEVVSQTCSADLTLLRKSPRDVTLVTFYADINYGIPFQEVVASEPCDSEGWQLPHLARLNSNIGGVSSYIHGNDCDDQIYYYEENYSGARSSHRYDNPWVGATWNDHLYSMKLWHG
ncbi:hypothetical protein ILP97_46410 [Amycolatopsis sp. H6(2020)]|nr:hypothetical protein [Amycolatopsis sp. H6(2020)]